MSVQPAPAAPAAQPGAPQDPYRAYNFKFEINGTVQGHFVRIDDLGFKLERILYRAGGEHAQVRSIPGHAHGHAHIRLYHHRRPPRGRGERCAAEARRRSQFACAHVHRYKVAEPSSNQTRKVPTILT